MGKEKASNHANKVLNKFRKIHPLEAEDLMTNVAEDREVYFDKIEGFFNRETKNSIEFDRGVNDCYVYKNNILYTTNMGKAREHFVNNEFSEIDKRKLNHKSSRELLMLEENKRVSIKIGKKPRKAYQIR